jgi:hypothetical protein
MMPAPGFAARARFMSNFGLRVTSGRCPESLWLRAKLRASVSRAWAASGGVRRMSCPVSATQGRGGRRLARFGLPPKQ